MLFKRIIILSFRLNYETQLLLELSSSSPFPNLRSDLQTTPTVCCIFSNWSDLQFSQKWLLQLEKIPQTYTDGMFKWAKIIQTPNSNLQTDETLILLWALYLFIYLCK